MVQENKACGIFHCELNPFKPVHQMTLCDGSWKILNVPNAGGSSIVSEVLSFEVMKHCFGANLIKTEMEVSYFPEGGSITDYTCSMFGATVGVSVTRAMKFKGEFTKEDAERLLMKKLRGIVQSNTTTLEGWHKQILHVWAPNHHVVNTVRKCFQQIPAELKSNTVILVTLAKHTKEIFRNSK